MYTWKQIDLNFYLTFIPSLGGKLTAIWNFCLHFSPEGLGSGGGHVLTSLVTQFSDRSCANNAQSLLLRATNASHLSRCIVNYLTHRMCSSQILDNFTDFFFVIILKICVFLWNFRTKCVCSDVSECICPNYFEISKLNEK